MCAAVCDCIGFMGQYGCHWLATVSALYKLVSVLALCALKPTLVTYTILNIKQAIVPKQVHTLWALDAFIDSIEFQTALLITHYDHY